MRRFALSLVVMTVFTMSASAQFRFGPDPGYFSPGIRINYVSRHLSITGYVGPQCGYRVYSPYAFAPVLVPTGYMPNTVILMQPRPANPVVTPARLLPNLPVVPPLQERTDVIVIRPRPGGANTPPPVRPAALKRAKQDQGFEPQPLLAPRAVREPADEAARQIKLGKSAFAAGEYGRALERFDRALALTPDRGEPYFLRSYAEQALAKYADAAASRLAGLKRQPDWPTTRFARQELYGPNSADAQLHSDQLRQAVAEFPHEPMLLFLLGCDCWFSGRQAEARAFLRQVQQLIADPKPLDAFLSERHEPAAPK